MSKKHKPRKAPRTLSAKCSISLKEARESNYWLRLLEASGENASDDLKLLAREADELSRIIGTIIVKTKNRRKDQ